MIKVVNIIPKSLSNEVNQDSEPSIAVNPENPAVVLITAFTPSPVGTPGIAPIFVSSDRGATWTLFDIIPNDGVATTGTYDITAAFGGGGRSYVGTINVRSPLTLNVMRPSDLKLLETRTAVGSGSADQPFVSAIKVPSGPDADKDRLYVGMADTTFLPGSTAVIDFSADAGTASPTFARIQLDKRKAMRNGFQTRVAAHSSGVIYAAFNTWREFNKDGILGDIVVTRDDNWGTGAAPFTNLIEPKDRLAGRLVRAGIQLNSGIEAALLATLGGDRSGHDIAIATDPNNGWKVYLAYADRVAGVNTLHLLFSRDAGNTWSTDLQTISAAKNPALAVLSNGQVCFAYQKVIGTAPSERWETHLEIAAAEYESFTDNVLAIGNVRTRDFLPYIGDYIRIVADGRTVYGVFSSDNEPDPANFPQGVTYLRNHNFATKQLLGLDGTTVIAPSIDPFFFSYTGPPPPPTRFTRIPPPTRFTIHSIISDRPVPHIGTGGLEPIWGESKEDSTAGLAEPFIRFGGRVFALEELSISGFDELSTFVEPLRTLGITRLDHLATCGPHELAVLLGWSPSDASRLIELGQRLLRQRIRG